MSLIKITDDVLIAREDVSSIQRETTYKYDGGSPSDTCMYADFIGSVITLKNGRKIYVRGLSPADINNIIEKAREATYGE